MAASGSSLASLASVMTRMPQVLINVPDVDKARAHSDEAVLAAIAEEESALDGKGRSAAASLGHAGRWCGSWSRRRRTSGRSSPPSDSPRSLTSALSLH